MIFRGSWGGFVGSAREAQGAIATRSIPKSVWAVTSAGESPLRAASGGSESARASMGRGQTPAMDTFTTMAVDVEVTEDELGLDLRGVGSPNSRKSFVMSPKVSTCIRFGGGGSRGNSLYQEEEII